MIPTTSSFKIESLPPLASFPSMTVIRPVSSSISMMWSPVLVSLTSLTMPMTLISFSTIMRFGSDTLDMVVEPLMSRRFWSMPRTVVKRSMK